MRLLCLTDLHGSRRALEAILGTEPPADALLLGGDLTDFGTPQDAAAVIALARRHSLQVFALAGNCDSPQIEAWLAEQGLSLHGRGARVGEWGFFGLSAAPPWQSWMYEFSEGELGESLARGYAQVAGCAKLVLVSHAPPRDCLDCTVSGAHAGSTAVRDWIRKARPALVVCGHIHEARGVEQGDTTVVVNCGVAAHGDYAVAELGEAVTVELRRAVTSVRRSR